jgi:hypothetical protein
MEMNNQNVNELFYGLVNSFQVRTDDLIYPFESDAEHLFGDIVEEDEPVKNNEIEMYQTENLNDALQNIVNNEVKCIVPVACNKAAKKISIKKPQAFNRGLTAKQVVELANESEQHRYRKSETWKKATAHFMLFDGKMMKKE